MKRTAIPALLSGNAEINRFAEAVKQQLETITGQSKNSPPLTTLASDASSAAIINLLNRIIARLGEDDVGAIETATSIASAASIASLTASIATLTTGLTQAAPPGTLAYFPFSAAPAGWLKRNGALLSRTTYAALFAVANADGLVSEATWAASSWGRFSVGDGSTTFRIPDGRGEFDRGLDDGRGVDSGRALGTSQLDQFQGSGQSIRYLGNPGQPQFALNPGGSQFRLPYVVDGSNSEYISTTSQFFDIGYGAARVGTTTRPRNVAHLACIKF